MAQANDSVLYTPGTGATVATHLVATKEYPVSMEADAAGHILGTKPQYFFMTPMATHAGVRFFDFFNGDASLIMRITTILHLPGITTAVVGSYGDWYTARTTTSGTGGTAVTAWLPDLSQTALDADITCRSKPTGGAAELAGGGGFNWAHSSEETEGGSMMMASLGGSEILPPIIQPPFGEGYVIRPGAGLVCYDSWTTVVGSSAFLIGFTVE